MFQACNCWAPNFCRFPLPTPCVFTLSFRVTDARTGWGLCGAQFELCRGSRTVAVCSSDFTGCVCFNNLEPGVYRMCEICPAPCFRPNSTIFFVRITARGDIFINGMPQRCFNFCSHRC